MIFSSGIVVEYGSRSVDLFEVSIARGEQGIVGVTAALINSQMACIPAKTFRSFPMHTC